MVIIPDIWSGSRLVKKILERKGKEGLKKKELEKEILKEAEKEQKKFIEVDKDLYNLVGKKPEHFVWISNYLDEILHHAEKMGMIKRKGERVEVVNRGLLNAGSPEAVYYVGKMLELAEKLGVPKGRMELSSALKAVKVICSEHEDLPRMTKDRYEGIRWEEGMEKVLRKLVERDSMFAGSPVAKEILEKIEKSGRTVRDYLEMIEKEKKVPKLPGVWEAILKDLEEKGEREKVSHEEVKEVLKKLNTIYEVFSRGKRHLEMYKGVDPEKLRKELEEVKEHIHEDIKEKAIRDLVYLVERYGHVDGHLGIEGAERMADVAKGHIWRRIREKEIGGEMFRGEELREMAHGLRGRLHSIREEYRRMLRK